MDRIISDNEDSCTINNSFKSKVADRLQQLASCHRQPALTFTPHWGI